MTRTRAIVISALVLAFVAATAATGIGQVWLHGRNLADSRNEDVLKAARTAVEHTLSYNYQTLGADAKSTETYLTGDALDQYQQVQMPLNATAPGLHAVVSASVKSATVLDASGTTSRVLLFVDQTSTSTKVTTPSLDQSRVTVTLTRKHGQWLVSSLQAI